MPDDHTTSRRFGKVRYATIRRDFQQLRLAIRAHDSFAAEEAWEKCERWLEAISPAALRALDAEEKDRRTRNAAF